MLEFEGVYRKAEVALNGQKAGFRPYGYTNFYVECDDFLTAGENTVEVIARNADQPNSRWYSGAGIYRPVRMWTGEKDRYIELNGVKIRTLSLIPRTDRGQGEDQRRGPGDGGDPGRRKVLASAAGAERTLQLTDPGAQPWSPEQPKLYTCRVRFGEDEARKPSASARSPGARTAFSSTASGRSCAAPASTTTTACWAPSAIRTPWSGASAS